MWGGTDEAKAKAQAWLAARVGEMESAPSALTGTSPASAGRGQVKADDVTSSGGLTPSGLLEAIFEVDWDNVAPARIFMGLVTQWRVTTMSGMAGGIRIKEGLDYNAMPVVAGALGVMLDADVLDGIQKLERVTMGLEAARATNKARKGKSS